MFHEKLISNKLNKTTKNDAKFQNYCINLWLPLDDSKDLLQSTRAEFGAIRLSPDGLSAACVPSFTTAPSNRNKTVTLWMVELLQINHTGIMSRFVKVFVAFMI